MKSKIKIGFHSCAFVKPIYSNDLKTTVDFILGLHRAPPLCKYHRCVCAFWAVCCVLCVVYIQYKYTIGQMPVPLVEPSRSPHLRVPVLLMQSFCVSSAVIFMQAEVHHKWVTTS